MERLMTNLRLSLSTGRKDLAREEEESFVGAEGKRRKGVMMTKLECLEGPAKMLDFVSGAGEA
jgi:hypothetical protein